VTNLRSQQSEEKVVEGWLAGQDTHKAARKLFPRNPYTVTNIDDICEMNLADMSSLSKHNDGYSFPLNVIDVVLRYA
jgi:hypothetical protein